MDGEAQSYVEPIKFLSKGAKSFFFFFAVTMSRTIFFFFNASCMVGEEEVRLCGFKTVALILKHSYL